MINHEIAKHFSLLSKLMDIHGANGLSRKNILLQHTKIEQLTVELQTLFSNKIFAINGIDEAIGKKIIELTETGKMKTLDDLIEQTHEGIFEIMKNKSSRTKKNFYHLGRNEC